MEVVGDGVGDGVDGDGVDGDGVGDGDGDGVLEPPPRIMSLMICLATS